MPAVDLGGLDADGAASASSAALCHIAAYRTGSAVVVAPMQYSQILWAVLYGAAFFGETPDWGTALGAAIIILSGIYVVFREERGDVSASARCSRPGRASSPAPTRGSRSRAAGCSAGERAALPEHVTPLHWPRQPH